MSSRSIGVTNVKLRRWMMSCVIRSPSCSQTSTSRASSPWSGHCSSIRSSSSAARTMFAPASSNRSKNSRSRGAHSWDRRAMAASVGVNLLSGAARARALRRELLAQALELLGGDPVGVLGPGETARAYVLGVGLDAAHHRLLEVRVPLDELRPVPVVDAQQVVVDQHLAVGRRPRADPDDRYLHRRHDRAGHVSRDRLEYDREAAALLERDGVVEYGAGALGGAALGAVAAERGRGLRRQGDVAHARHTGVDDRTGALCHRAAALELDGVAARLLDDPVRSGDGVL